MTYKDWLEKKDELCADVDGWIYYDGWIHPTDANHEPTAAPPDYSLPARYEPFILKAQKFRSEYKDALVDVIKPEREYCGDWSDLGEIEMVTAEPMKRLYASWLVRK